MVAGIATAALAFFYCAAFFLMPLYLGQVRHQHSAAIGWWLMPTTAVMGLTSPWVGRLVDRRGTTLPLLGGFFFLTVSALLQSRFNASTAWPVVTAAFVCMGIGWAAILGPSTVSALASVAPERSGAATGAAWTLHNVGGALGLSMATVMFRIGSEVPGAAASRTNFVGGYRAAMWLLASVTAAALVMVATHARSDDKRRRARK
jgi:MFS family permease